MVQNKHFKELKANKHNDTYQQYATISSNFRLICATFTINYSYYYYTMVHLSDRLQELRKGLGLSQQELADTVEISKSMLSRYENHNVQPPADILNKLANALNTSVDFLLNGTKSEKAKASLKNNELLQAFKDVDEMPDKEQATLLHFINVYLRDFKARKAYGK